MSSATGNPDHPSRNRISSVSTILILSLIGHALLIFFFRDYRAELKASDTALLKPLEVRIQFIPSVPTAPVLKPVLAAPSPKHPSASTTLKSSAPAQPATPTISLPTDTTAHPTKRQSINIDQIRQNVGKIVKDIDAERDQLAVGQLRTKPLYAHDGKTPFARAVEATGRSDCLAPAALPGGLLAPFLLLMDKKGTGCKF
ncbi:hypothetical protein ACVBEF_12795 [Glaciimonas sp. GG7]